MIKMATAFLAIALSSCAMMAEQESASYKVGFDEGCATANAEEAGIARAPQRNTQLYAKDSDYRGGWLTGHETCQIGSQLGSRSVPSAFR
jgi:hypothetical protein